MIECEATDNEVVENVATPEALSVAVPREVIPSMKFTVPVGVPAPDEATVAVKLTDCPNTAGLTDAVTTVVVAAATVPWAAN